MYRLASFPLLHPEPLLELAMDGSLLYANRAAHLAFPDLLSLGAGHPVIQAALAQSRSVGPAEGRPRTIQQDGRTWELMVVLPPDSELLRVFARDVKAR